MTQDFREALAREGYVVLRGAVPEALVRRARTAIEASVAKDARDHRGTHCPELVSDPCILSLLDPVKPFAREVFARPMLPTSDRAQIALRFPMAAPSGDTRFNQHLDGYPTSGNKVPSGRIHRLTMLVGVYLTELAGPNRGNLVVWPGSHVRFARYFREIDAPTFLAKHGAEALLERISAFDAGEPLQLEVSPGDAVLAHHLLAHGTADNLSEETREAVYFRLMHPDDRSSDPTPLLDERRYFDGLPWPAAA